MARSLGERVGRRISKRINSSFVASPARQRHTKASLDESDAYLEQALGLDPNYGIAWMWMAANTMIRADSGFIPPTEGYERGRQLAQKALQLSPDSATAYAGLQYVNRTLDWELGCCTGSGTSSPLNSTRTMRSHFAQAEPSRLHPVVGMKRSRSFVRHWRAIHSTPFVSGRSSSSTTPAQRYADVETTIRRLWELAPDYLWTHAYLGKTYLAEGKSQEALEMVQQEPDEWIRLWFLPIVLRGGGKQQRRSRGGT